MELGELLSNGGFAVALAGAYKVIEVLWARHTAKEDIRTTTQESLVNDSRKAAETATAARIQALEAQNAALATQLATAQDLLTKAGEARVGEAMRIVKALEVHEDHNDATQRALDALDRGHHESVTREHDLRTMNALYAASAQNPQAIALLARVDEALGDLRAGLPEPREPREPQPIFARLIDPETKVKDSTKP